MTDVPIGIAKDFEMTYTDSVKIKSLINAPSHRTFLIIQLIIQNLLMELRLPCLMKIEQQLLLLIMLFFITDLD